MKKIILALTICIMAFVLAGCSGVDKEAIKNPTEIDSYLAAAVGGNDENIEKALIYPQDASFTRDGITVTARQAVADRHSMYVLLSVTATPEMEFNYNDSFDMCTARVNGESGSNGIEWMTPSKDKKTLYVIAGVDSEEEISDGTVTVALYDLKKTDLSGEEKIYKGTWNVDFEFEAADITERYTSDTVVQTSGLELTFNYIDISPFGVYVSCKLADSSINPGEDWEEEAAEIKIIMKDGKSVSATRNLCATTYGGIREEFKYYRRCKLSTSIIPTEVESIMFNGQQVELK